MPAIVEGNDRSIEGLAGAQTRDDARTRAVPQCPRSGDDARGLRVHSSQARQDSEKALFLAGGKAGVSTCVASLCLAPDYIYKEVRSVVFPREFGFERCRVLLDDAT